MRFVHILRSVDWPSQRCFGITLDLKQRLEDYNAGRSPHTTKFRPWVIKTYTVFSDEKKAVAFEKYIKQGSGWAFTKKHLWGDR